MKIKIIVMLMMLTALARASEYDANINKRMEQASVLGYAKDIGTAAGCALITVVAAHVDLARMLRDRVG